MKRWEHVGGHSYCEFIQVSNGEWVKADIAEEMYETLLQIEKDFLHNYPADQSIDYNTFLKLTGVLQKARGE